MPIVNPTEEQLAEFAAEAVDRKPIVMVNLLRFRDAADYGSGPEARLTGRKAYDRYTRAVMPLLWEVGGQVLWRGHVRSSFIAPEGECWDEALLVHYPDRAAFVRMVNSPAYREAMTHRTAALADSRLLETRPGRLPKVILNLVRGAVRLRRLLSPRVR